MGRCGEKNDGFHIVRCLQLQVTGVTDLGGKEVGCTSLRMSGWQMLSRVAAAFQSQTIAASSVLTLRSFLDFA